MLITIPVNLQLHSNSFLNTIKKTSNLNQIFVSSLNIEEMNKDSHLFLRGESYEHFSDDSGFSKKIFIVFDPTLDYNDRIFYLKKIDSNVKIRYNYKYIPVVSVEFSQSPHTLFKQNPLKFLRITKIVNLHQTRIERPEYSRLFFSDEQKNNSSSNMENWWLNSIDAADVQYTGKGVKIAIIDTGISVHPDFFSNGNSRIIASKNFTSEAGVTQNQYYFDDYGHGTHVAGIAAGNGFLSDGKYRGVASQALLYNAKISNSTGFIEEDDVVAAIEWCIDEQVDIISMSFGDTIPEVWTIQTMAIQQAVEHGIVAFASAGNSGPGFFTSGTPASGLFSIAVGATDENNQVAQFSSWGPTYSNQLNPEICAPGVNIIAPLSKSSILDLEMNIRENKIDYSSNFGYIPLSGTSMACPIAAGAAALLIEAYPNASPETIRNALIEGAKEINSGILEGKMVRAGAGLINISKSLQILEEWSTNSDGVNDNIRIFPNIFPYAPYDFFNYPGDQIILNYTLIKGSSATIKIELPNIPGIEFQIVSNNSFTYEKKIVNVPIYARILYNATPGYYSGNILVKNAITGTLLDQIESNIIIKTPKAKVYFDSYHGLNDFYPSNFSTFSQIDLYHLFSLLNSQNYQVAFNMEHWTPFYNASLNSPILTSEILSNIDILVLQAPIIPYNRYEIQEITNFYNEGGSILFLGTVNNLLCTDSLNALFDSLNTNIKFGENLVNLRNFGYFSQAIPFNNLTLNEEVPLLTNISEFYYSFGTSFVNQTPVIPLISVDGKIVAMDASFNRSTGKFLLFGDYHFLTTSVFTSERLYTNLSAFATNIFDYLRPSDKIRIDLSYNHQYTVNTTKIPIKLQILDQISKELYSNFAIGSALNMSLLFPNGTVKNLDVIENSKLKAYFSSIPLNNLNFSRYPLILTVNLQINETIYSDTFKFIHEVSDLISPYKISSLDEKLDRLEPGPSIFAINTSETDIFRSINAIIFPNSYFSINNLEILETNLSSFENYSIISYEFTSRNPAGEIIFTPNDLSNQSINRIDLYPSRISFSLIDYLPEVKETSSFIGSNPFTEYQNGDYIIPVQILVNQEIPLQVSIVDYDDNPVDRNKFKLSCSLIPGIIYHNFFNPIFPQKIWYFNLNYNTTSQFYEGNIVIPAEFQFSGFSGSVKYSSESDFLNFYTLALISVIDPSGGSNFYPLLFMPYEKPIHLFNLTPIFMLYGLIALSIVFIEKGSKWKQKIRFHRISHNLVSKKKF